MKDFVTLIDGTEIDLHAPDFTGVSLESFARMLYRNLRYNGATRRPYCVLEHTVRGTRAARDSEQSRGLGAYARRTALHFLMHDLHEIAIGDMPSPVIRAIGKPQVDAIKHRLDLAVYARFGEAPADDHIRECVTAMDQCMFQREWLDLMPTRFDRAAPGGCHDGPVRDFMFEHDMHPEPIDPDFRPTAQHLVGEFCHLWREVRK